MILSGAAGGGTGAIREKRLLALFLTAIMNCILMFTKPRLFGPRGSTMSKRQRVPDPDQAEVLVRSRRRCCVCFGLNRDEGVKKGQIAHLDGNPNNSSPDNLAFLCFDHHDTYDGRTSQSKNLTAAEVKKYRDELYAHFGDWQVRLTHDNMLAFLASTISLDQMADGAVKIAGEVLYYSEEHAYDVLVSKKKDYSDLDLLIPYLHVLDRFAAWGWLTYTMEERTSVSGEERTYVCVTHNPVCGRVASVIRKRTEAKHGDVSGLDRLDACADGFADEPADDPKAG